MQTRDTQKQFVAGKPVTGSYKGQDTASDTDQDKPNNRQSAGTTRADEFSVSGEFVDLGGERFYAIRNVDRMPPFFISVVSDSDHWLFVSSTGGLTAGRVSPESALFPYVTVDKIHDSPLHTGCKTLIRLEQDGKRQLWEPFNSEHDGRYQVTRNLYKNILGNKLCFEEINTDLGLAYRYTWTSSAEYGFVRQCEIENIGDQQATVDIVDGYQNILPAGTQRSLQDRSSNLVDAYKWSELDASTGLAMYTLYSGITDRAEPLESLLANTVFCLGLDDSKILMSSTQLKDFRQGNSLQQENHKRGVRGAYLVNKTMNLDVAANRSWLFIADMDKNQAEVIKLAKQLQRPDIIADKVKQSVDQGTDKLARIMAACDAYQLVNSENDSAHHYANVLFNVLRGGTINDQYRISKSDFVNNVRHYNNGIYKLHSNALALLPDSIKYDDLVDFSIQEGDAQLQRLVLEYLPITFGRRHGDPSRPWNLFEIRTVDDNGDPLLYYAGNWRDIFQNWEALVLSYPDFIESMIAKFVNASTVDGYNPYRITKQGIDWEVDDPDDPWSYIGYWGDHQIIYLLKFLEASRNFHPQRLKKLLRNQVFSYANVPYRIRPFADLVQDAKTTVDFDNDLAALIEQRIEETGSDGRLVLDKDGQVYLVNLLEKLLVPLLAKLSNLVVDGGIWLNTQRPEWNDANNALVGQGLSMVTLYYMRRYIQFMLSLLESESESFELSEEVGEWLEQTCTALSAIRTQVEYDTLTAQQRYRALSDLGHAASRYRERLYNNGSFTGRLNQSVYTVKTMLDDALVIVDSSIKRNHRQDGLYHAYNLLSTQAETLHIDQLYPMLEGQVAALSSGALEPEQAIEVIEALFASDMFRPDQQSFMLYPDRALPGFLQKNRVPEAEVMRIPLLAAMLESGDDRLILRDGDGLLRFHPELTNIAALEVRLMMVADDYDDMSEQSTAELLELYEQVFNHKAFTGRSGGMFGFEGLGCIYWHMVSKLLLAVQENYLASVNGSSEETSQRLGDLYYRVREGIGFNKTPSEYGAFPTDPYSHTPGHAGAQQPGMTGQVKEEIITRFGELGIRLNQGKVSFASGLLRKQEFLGSKHHFRYLDVYGEWNTITVPRQSLCFTWCQVPFIYELDETSRPALLVENRDGTIKTMDSLELPAEESRELFAHSGRIKTVKLVMPGRMLFDG